MKITDIQVDQLKSTLKPGDNSFVGRPGRLIVRVFTDEGLVGVAEGSRGLGVFRAYLGGRNQASP